MVCWGVWSGYVEGGVEGGGERSMGWDEVGEEEGEMRSERGDVWEAECV